MIISVHNQLIMHLYKHPDWQSGISIKIEKTCHRLVMPWVVRLLYLIFKLIVNGVIHTYPLTG